MKIVAVKNSRVKTRIIFLFEEEKSNIPSIQKLQDQSILSGKVQNIVPVFDDDRHYLVVGLGKKENLTMLSIGKNIKQLYQHLKLLNITDITVDTQ